jgi:hypothetical protein
MLKLMDKAAGKGNTTELSQGGNSMLTKLPFKYFFSLENVRQTKQID